MKLAVLVLPLADGVIPPNTPEAGVAVAVVLALGLTALAAVGSTAAMLHRRQSLTAFRGAIGVAAALGVAGLALVGIVALSPAPASARVLDGTPHDSGAGVLDLDGPGGLQLPTLSGE